MNPIRQAVNGFALVGATFGVGAIGAKLINNAAGAQTTTTPSTATATPP